MSKKHKSSLNEYNHETMTGDHPEADRYHGNKAEDFADGADENNAVSALKDGASLVMGKLKERKVQVAIAATGVGLLGAGYLAKRLLKGPKGSTKSKHHAAAHLAARKIPATKSKHHGASKSRA